MRTRKASKGGNPFFTRKHVKPTQVMPYMPKLNEKNLNTRNIVFTPSKQIITRKLVKPTQIMSMRAKFNKGTRNNKNLIRQTAQPIKPLLESKSFSIRNLPRNYVEGTAQFIQQPKPILLPQFNKLSMTRKYKLPRTRGNRNIFKSMENKEKFKRVLKDIYGPKYKNVYKSWETHKNNLMDTLRNLESDAESRRSFSSNSASETNNMLNNANPEFYRYIKNLYGKNYADFQDYMRRAKKQKIDVGRYSF